MRKYENPKNNFEVEINKICERLEQRKQQYKIAYAKSEIHCLYNIYNSLSEEKQKENHSYFMTIFNKL